RSLSLHDALPICWPRLSLVLQCSCGAAVPSLVRQNHLSCPCSWLVSLWPCLFARRVSYQKVSLGLWKLPKQYCWPQRCSAWGLGFISDRCSRWAPNRLCLGLFQPRLFWLSRWGARCYSAKPEYSLRKYPCVYIARVFLFVY